MGKKDWDWSGKILSQVIRKHAANFKKTGKVDEPPLRVLEYGLSGEHVVVPPGSSAPFPYMIQRGDNYYHAYRWREGCNFNDL